MITAVDIPGERPLFWVASSKKDLLVMPQPVMRAVGIALGVAQQGGKHPSSKPWKGEGAGVMEAVVNYGGDTFRAVYTISFEKAVYVLHCFQKKSPSGRKTAKTDVDLIRARLRAVRLDYARQYGKDP